VALRLAVQSPAVVRRLVLVSTPYAQSGFYPEMLPQQAMVSSAFTAPHVTEWITVDVTKTMELVETLKKDREFAWAVGKEMSCWLREPLDGRRELSGRLVAVSGTELSMAEPDGRTTEVPRALVTKARLDLAFGRPRARKR